MRLVILLLAAGMLVFAAIQQAAAAESRPNIIFVLADDLGYGDLGCFGQEHIKTPALDRMASEGMRLTRHYAGSTVCAPSRYTLITGRHIGRSQTVGQEQELPTGSQTLGTVLKQAGYRCGVIGKWGIGKTTGHPLDQGFDHWFGFIDQVRAHFYYPDYIWRNRDKVPLPDNTKTQHTYIHDSFTDEALGFIEESSKQPFFLYLPYTIPHAETLVPDDSQAPYIPLLGDPERPPIDKPYKMAGYNQPRYPRAARAGMISRLDRDMGRIRAKLEELGLDKNTLIVFSSDNGPTKAGNQDVDFFKSAGGLRGLKRTLYEGGLRMPTIVWGPGRVPAGRSSAAVSISYDWLATFADLTGVTLTQPHDGRSLLQVIEGKAETVERDHLYWDFSEKGQLGEVSALLQEPWKLVVQQGPEPRVELYNLVDDPQETKDLSGKEKERVERMKAVIDAYRAEQAAR
jgi:arylsulfatase A-like enzyme